MQVEWFWASGYDEEILQILPRTFFVQLGRTNNIKIIVSRFLLNHDEDVEFIEITEGARNNL